MKKNGISLIILVITIMVMLILVSITIITNRDTAKKARLASFSQEIANLKVATNDMRIEDPNNDRNLFIRISIINAPATFASLDSQIPKGYWIDVERMGFETEGYGREIIDEGVATFGETDIFVCDKNGTVYYLKGVEDGERVYYNATTYVEK